MEDRRPCFSKARDPLKIGKETERPTKNRSLPQPLLQRLSLFSLVVLFFLHTCHGDVGTAAHYSPPYLPTTCYGSDTTEFPSSNLFAVAGDGIWDNGAACGRQYLVRCISASLRYACAQNQTIQIKIVDYVNGMPSPPTAHNTTMILSSTAFGAIGNTTTNAPAINIEFTQV